MGSRVRALALIVSAAASLAATGSAGAGSATSRWVATASLPVQTLGALAAGTPFASGTGGRTVRDLIRITLGGSELRVGLTNVFGTHTVTFTDVRVAVSAGRAAIDPGGPRVQFAGRSSVSIPAGGQVQSDAVKLAVHAGEQLAVSLFSPDPTGRASASDSLVEHAYISGAGDATGATSAAQYPTVSDPFWLGGIDVTTRTAGAGAIAVLGDSIAAGAYSRGAGDWPDQLSRRLRVARTALSVLNGGISGNSLHEGTPCFGQSGLTRLGRDALDQPGVRYVILALGTNDITQPTEPRTASLYQCLAHRRISAAQLIALYQQVIARAHADQLKVIGTTILPFGGYRYWTAAIESARTQINHWVMTSHAFDGVIDFASAVADPKNPALLAPQFDSGDGLHPNDAGYAAMARSVKLSLFAGG